MISSRVVPPSRLSIGITWLPLLASLGAGASVVGGRELARVRQAAVNVNWKFQRAFRTAGR
jgi:hypothetical protein